MLGWDCVPQKDLVLLFSSRINLKHLQYIFLSNSNWDIPYGHILNITILMVCLLPSYQIFHLSYCHLSGNPGRNSSPQSATLFSEDLVPILCEGACTLVL